MKEYPWRGFRYVQILSAVVVSSPILVSSSFSWWGGFGNSGDESLPPSFDLCLAREIVMFTQAAYCTDQLVDWDCPVCQSFPGMKNVSILQGESRNVRGFIGVDMGRGGKGGEGSQIEEAAGLISSNSERGTCNFSNFNSPRRNVRVREMGGGGRGRRKGRIGEVGRESARPRIVVTFSGTDPKSINNLIDDVEAAPIAHSYGENCGECKVHHGFLASYEVVQEQVRTEVASHLRYNPTAEVLVTGHSLGGALATLCLLDLQATLGSDLSFAPLYIYGAPRVGNSAFAAYSVSLGVPIFRLVHNRDPVPHLPFKSWGYGHPPREVFFDAPQTSFVVCDESGEDPTCSDQFWVMPDLAHIVDHLLYLQVDYTKGYVACLLGSEEEDERLEKAAAISEMVYFGAAKVII